MQCLLTIVITTLVIFNSKSTLSAIPLYITTETNYVTEPDAVLVYCPRSRCHHNGDHYKRPHAMYHVTDRQLVRVKVL